MKMDDHDKQSASASKSLLCENLFGIDSSWLGLTIKVWSLIVNENVDVMMIIIISSEYVSWGTILQLEPSPPPKPSLMLSFLMDSNDGWGGADIWLYPIDVWIGIKVAISHMNL